MSNTKKYLKQKKIDLLGNLAEGVIGPATRRGSDERPEVTVQLVAKRLVANDFFVTTNEFVPRQCVDGRGRADGKCKPAPNAAGGTLSLVIAEALLNNRFNTTGQNAAEHAETIFKFLKDNGFIIGGHNDDHAELPNCGCGACDKLREILNYIVRRGADIKAFLRGLSISVSDSVHQTIVSKASELLSTNYAVPGNEIQTVFAKVAGKAAVETLTGPHNEVVLIINGKPGTTLNRQRLADKFGQNYQAFNLDVWALKKSSSIMALKPNAAAPVFIAALYYNVATAAILADKSLKIVVR